MCALLLGCALGGIITCLDVLSREKNRSAQSCAWPGPAKHGRDPREQSCRPEHSRSASRPILVVKTSVTAYDECRIQIIGPSCGARLIPALERPAKQHFHQTPRPYKMSTRKSGTPSNTVVRANDSVGVLRRANVAFPRRMFAHLL